MSFDFDNRPPRPDLEKMLKRVDLFDGPSGATAAIWTGQIFERVAKEVMLPLGNRVAGPAGDGSPWRQRNPEEALEPAASRDNGPCPARGAGSAGGAAPDFGLGQPSK